MVESKLKTFGRIGETEGVTGCCWCSRTIWQGNLTFMVMVRMVMENSLPYPGVASDINNIITIHQSLYLRHHPDVNYYKSE